jgi:dihydropteroate synthase
MPLLMGVLNVTPDSFYDGGRYLEADAAERRVEALLAQGTDIIDIGAESTRPGSASVPPIEQIRRLAPAVARGVAHGAFVSVDTTSAQVAEHCLARGVRMVNDVSCLSEPRLAGVTAEAGGWLVIGHSRAPMSEMSGFSQWPDDDYADIVRDVMEDWGKARDTAIAEGMPLERLVFDPGLGFSKNARHCYSLLARLDEFRSLGVPMLIGPSRKSFIAVVDGSAVDDRLGGTISSCLIGAQAGAAAVRVHDVAPVRQALLVWQRSRRQESGGTEHA